MINIHQKCGCFQGQNIQGRELSQHLHNGVHTITVH